MNRLIKKCVHGFSRLAFWRKLAPAIEATPTPVPTASPIPTSAPIQPILEPDTTPVPIAEAMSTELLELSEHSVSAEQPEALAEIEMEPEEPGASMVAVVVTPDQTPPPTKPTATDVPTDAVPEKPSLLARLKSVFRQKPGGDAETAEVPETRLADGLKPGQPSHTAALVQASASSRQPSEDQATDAAPDKLSSLARLKTVFRRKASSDAEKDAEADTSSEAESDADADAVEAGRLQRMLAKLSNKWVWIPGLGIILLVPSVIMALMLMQSAQEKTRLQEALLATQKKLEQSKLVEKPAVSPTANKQAGHASEPGENSMSASAEDAVDSPPGADAGDCVVTDQASVIKNLKNCIEGYNRSTAR